MDDAAERQGLAPLHPAALSGMIPAMHRPKIVSILVLPLLFCSGATVVAQDQVSTKSAPHPAAESAPSPTPVAAAPSPPTTMDALRSLVESMTSIRAQIDAQTLLTKAGQPDPVRDAAKSEIASLQKSLTALQSDFDSIASGVDSEELQTRSATPFDLKSQLDQLLQPLIQEINSATEQPRAIEKLRGELAQLQRQETLLRDAVLRLKTMQKDLPKAKEGTQEAQLRRSLDQTTERWTRLYEEVKGRAKALDYQLNEQLSRRKSIWDLLTTTASTFFVTRGLHLLLAVVALVLAFTGWRSLHQWLIQLSPWHRITPKPFAVRVLDVIYHSLAVVIAIIAFVMVLYITGDWLMLGLTIIALLALLLAVKTVLPKYYQQARLLLNLGDVREGECVIINGLRWEVKSLNMFCRLVNPAMNPPSLRVPISQIINLSSRAHDPREPWFPCKEGDWLVGGDGRVTKAVCISPDYVQLVDPGGSRRTLGTQAFVTLGVTNISGGFRISSTIRLSLSNLHDATEMIPKKMAERTRIILLESYGREVLRNLSVELKSTQLTHLEYEITGDFDGAVADKYASLQRHLHRAAIEACTGENWQIASSPVPVVV